MGGNEYGESGPFWRLIYFHSIEALNDAFKVQFFQGFIFTPYQRHWYHLRPCSSDFFFKVKTCLQLTDVNAKIFYTIWILTLSDMTGSFKEKIGTEYCRDFENARNIDIIDLLKGFLFLRILSLLPITCTCISRLLFMIFLSLSLLIRSGL